MPTRAKKRIATVSLPYVRAVLGKLGLTCTKKDGQYRVNFEHGTEETAYFTDDLDDALATGCTMAEDRKVKNYADGCSAARALANLAAATLGLDGGDLDREFMAKVAVQILRDDREYLAIGPNYWGRGSSQAAALDSLVKAGGSRRQWIMYSVPQGAAVNDWGSITYPSMYEKLGVAKPFEVDRMGAKTRDDV